MVMVARVWIVKFVVPHRCFLRSGFLACGVYLVLMVVQVQFSSGELGSVVSLAPYVDVRLFFRTSSVVSLSRFVLLSRLVSELNFRVGVPHLVCNGGIILASLSSAVSCSSLIFSVLRTGCQSCQALILGSLFTPKQRAKMRPPLTGGRGGGGFSGGRGGGGYSGGRGGSSGGRGRGGGRGFGDRGGRGGGRGMSRGGGRGDRGGRGRGGRGGMKGGSKVIVEPHRHAGVFIAKGKEDALVTRNLVPGEAVYNEKRISVPNEDGTKTEYRVWNPFRSKLAAAILGGVDNIYIKPGAKVLYLGAASGTTVSHVSDLVGPARIVALNASFFLKTGGHFVISIKANCIDSTVPAEAVFQSEVKKLQQEQFKPAEQVTLEPFERDHACVVGTYRAPKKAKAATAA
ncbi:hypothetical protein Bca101_092002 [Brassica carinata]